MQTPTLTPTTQVYNLIILDKSGSMNSFRMEVIDGFKETLGSIRAAQRKHKKCQEYYDKNKKQGISTELSIFVRIDPINSMANGNNNTDNTSFFFGLLNGKEPFLMDGKPIGLTIGDFWSFQFSNIWEMAEEIAEFLVAKALNLTLPQNKIQWTLYDMMYREKRIEVKTSTYFHAWSPNKYTERRAFGITKAYSTYKDNTSTLERQNDVYVFCITEGKDQCSADPRNLDNWRFYVVPTSIINRACGDNKHISLGRVSKLSFPKDGVRYDKLKDAIDHVLDIVEE